MMGRRNRDGRTSLSRGFTLVEVLVALAVFGLVLAGIVQGVQFGLRAWAMQDRMVSGRADLDAVSRVLRGLVARMDPGSAATPPRVNGDRFQFVFTTDLPEAAGDALQRHADVALLVGPAHTLLMRWTPHTHALAAVPLPPSEAALLTGLSAIRFEYLYPVGAKGSGWTETWSEDYLPRLVRIHLAFPEADPRHWPDIVAEPAQDRPRE